MILLEIYDLEDSNLKADLHLQKVATDRIKRVPFLATNSLGTVRINIGSVISIIGNGSDKCWVRHKHHWERFG